MFRSSIGNENWTVRKELEMKLSAASLSTEQEVTGIMLRNRQTAVWIVVRKEASH